MFSIFVIDMKQIFHKIVSMLMAFVVLFSTMSFTIDMHYCGDTLVDFAVLKKAESCGMNIQKHASNDCSVAEKSCCSDKQTIVEGQDELQSSFDSLSLEQQQFVTSFVYSYINLLISVEKETNSYRGYSPLIVVKEIYKLDETYLI